jgi:hypothetical protein
VVLCSLARRTMMCFYSRASRRLGVPCTPRRRRAVQGAAWARVTTCRGRLANGGAWAARCGQRARTTWLGQGPTDIAHRDQGARRTDRWARAGLGVRVRLVLWHANAAGREQHGDVVRAGALPIFEFGIALFDCRLLKILQQKWTKWIIGKL